jgi:16S rRNA (cytosine1402-N4)-methyltransferase
LAILLDMPQTHVPVLAGELIEALDPRPGQVAIDCTLGGGGHARLVADRLGPAGTLIAIDRDPTAEAAFEQLSAEVACHTRFVRADFATGLQQLIDEGVRADMAYMDLGISSMQVDTRERGFSYAYDAPLDMRMDPDQELTAAEIVNTWERRRIARVLREYGEERYASRIAAAIVRQREQAPFTTSARLVELLYAEIPAPARRTGGHPAKRTFQALRMEVNDELAVLRRAIPAAIDAIRVGGRVVVESYHSLEDRLVKQAFTAVTRSEAPPDLPVVPEELQPAYRLVTRGAEHAGVDEIATNPRAASVRLRAIERIRGAA